MAQLRIDRRGRLLFELLDPFRDGLQAFGVKDGITAAFFVADDRETLRRAAARSARIFSIGKSLKRRALTLSLRSFSGPYRFALRK